MDLGGLATSLALYPYLGQKCAIAILSLVTTRRVLCSPCHFNPRVAPRAKGVGAKLQTSRGGGPPLTPAHSSSCPASELRASSPSASPAHSLPAPVFQSQPGVPNSIGVFWVMVTKSCLVPTVNLYLLRGPCQPLTQA